MSRVYPYCLKTGIWWILDQISVGFFSSDSYLTLKFQSIAFSTSYIRPNDIAGSGKNNARR